MRRFALREIERMKTSMEDAGSGNVTTGSTERGGEISKDEGKKSGVIG